MSSLPPFHSGTCSVPQGVCFHCGQQGHLKKNYLKLTGTSFGTIDAIVSKNWLKRITNTLTDMELDDSLKLKMATSLMDKSAATWWDNLKLHTSTLSLGSCLSKNSMINFILDSIETKRDKSSSD